MNMPKNLRPDISERPHQLNVEKAFSYPPEVLYVAWTARLGEWFASSDSVNMQAQVGNVFYFETVHKFEGRQEAKRHPHYGRFLNLEKNKLIEMTWVTGAGGTEGAETILKIELKPQEDGSLLSLSHSGFATAKAREAHEHAWPFVLENLEAKLADFNSQIH